MYSVNFPSALGSDPSNRFASWESDGHCCWHHWGSDPGTYHYRNMQMVGVIRQI